MIQNFKLLVRRGPMIEFITIYKSWQLLVTMLLPSLFKKDDVHTQIHAKYWFS